MPDFSIDTFTSNLTKGGALASLFECELTSGKGSVLTSSISSFKFLCKGVISVSYTHLTLPTNREV